MMKKNGLGAAVAVSFLSVVAVGVVSVQAQEEQDVPAFMQNMDEDNGDAGKPSDPVEAGSGPGSVSEASGSMEDPQATSRNGAVQDPEPIAGDPEPLPDPLPEPSVVDGGDKSAPVGETGGNGMDKPHRMTEQERRHLDDLRRLQRESELWSLRNEVMEQRQNYAEMRDKMEAIEREESKSEEEASDSTQPFDVSVQSSDHVGSAFDRHLAQDERALSRMRLVSVFGDRNNPKAELFFGGARMQVELGDRLPGDWMVIRIEMTRVVAHKGTRSFEIGLDRPPRETRDPRVEVMNESRAGADASRTGLRP